MASDPSTWLLVATAAVAVVAVGLLLARRRTDRALTPTRLGPAWSPPGGDPQVGGDAELDPGPDERVAPLAEATGVDPAVVAEVLGAWDEYLAVIGLLSLPATHRYRVYDPYDPPIAERSGDGRTTADPVRVARDAARRRPGVDEVDARAVLAALSEED
ncbi:MAG: hypothetical protein WD638_10455 [Nitriliruptoraceae bacterium]